MAKLLFGAAWFWSGVFFMLFGANAWAEPAHEFIGAAKCSLCHKKPEQGNQYGIWLDSKHAKAWYSGG
jgi:hypothetical protein